MIVIVGCIVVLGAVIGGFTISGGQIGALFIPPNCSQSAAPHWAR